MTNRTDTVEINCTITKESGVIVVEGGEGDLSFEVSEGEALENSGHGARRSALRAIARNAQWTADEDGRAFTVEVKPEHLGESFRI